MDKTLPFSNWSLKKAQETVDDSFSKARISILFIMLLFTFIKAVLVIGLCSVNGQLSQLPRAIFAAIIYVGLAKVLLSRPGYIKSLTHIMIVLGTLIVWTNIFMYAHKINLITVQFSFMIALSGFYVLGNAFGIAYSIAGMLPVVLFLVFNGNIPLSFAHTGQELASPAFEIIAILNFVTIIIAHYLFFQATNTNIREKETLNQQLQVSIAAANKLAISKSNFLSTMSHELRTPLNSVIGISELLLEDKPGEWHKENLRILQLSAHDLLALINNILDFNKIDSEKPTLEKVPFHLAQFMENICAVLRIKAGSKNLKLIFEIDGQLKNTSVISDPTRLSQVIYNLVGNAIKFTDKGSVIVKLSLVKRTEQGADILFSVADTGIGIHPDKHETIFELFSQSESHITRQYGGTGLGLAIVKQIVNLFNSTIQLESSPGNGSKFFFTASFPIAEHAPTKSLPVSTDKHDFSHLSVLVAEDNMINKLVIKKQLNKLNITPLIVENGEEAYKACLSNHFDVIFMDLNMPGLNGYESMKQIRSLADGEKAKVAIIAFTASVTKPQEIADNGFDDFLYKPVNLNELRDKLEKITAQSLISA